MSSSRSGSGSQKSSGNGKSGGAVGSASVKTSAAPKPESPAAAAANTPRRRLGRGLSSLLNEAIAVSVPPPAATPVPSGPASVPAPLPVPEPVAPPAPSPVPARNEPPPALPAQAVPAGPAPGPSAPSHIAVAQSPSQVGEERDAGAQRVVSLPVGTIAPSPFQPRRIFDQEALDRLAASIRTAGVMQPVLVRRAPGSAGGSGGGGGGAKFELVAGERRWRAAQLAGLAAVPAIIADLGDEQAAEWALIENVQREELGAMERATALRSLVERFGLTHAEAAEKVGLDRSSVTNLIRLTELEGPIQALLEAGKLGVGHGKALLAAPAGPARVALAKRAAEGTWSVRKLERAAPAAALALSPGADSPEDQERRIQAQARELGRSELERQLGEHLGTKVHIRTSRTGARGRLIVEFYDLDHFDGLMSRIGFQIK